MKLLNKIGRVTAVLAIVPFAGFERKERDGRLEERLQRSQQRYLERKSQSLDLLPKSMFCRIVKCPNAEQ
jgi:hypothetical protein